jgi:hypothetical protein
MVLILAIVAALTATAAWLAGRRRATEERSGPV